MYDCCSDVFANLLWLILSRLWERNTRQWCTLLTYAVRYISRGIFFFSRLHLLLPAFFPILHHYSSLTFSCCFILSDFHTRQLLSLSRFPFFLRERKLTELLDTFLTLHCTHRYLFIYIIITSLLSHFTITSPVWEGKRSSIEYISYFPCM